MRNFSAFIKEWKGDRSEVESAAILSVSPNTLGNWCDGTSLPPKTRVPHLAKLLGVKPARLQSLINAQLANKAKGSAP